MTNPNYLTMKKLNFLFFTLLCCLFYSAALSQIVEKSNSKDDGKYVKRFSYRIFQLDTILYKMDFTDFGEKGYKYKTKNGGGEVPNKYIEDSTKYMGDKRGYAAIYPCTLDSKGEPITINKPTYLRIYNCNNAKDLAALKKALIAGTVQNSLIKKLDFALLGKKEANGIIIDFAVSFKNCFFEGVGFGLEEYDGKTFLTFNKPFTIESCAFYYTNFFICHFEQNVTISKSTFSTTVDESEDELNPVVFYKCVFNTDLTFSKNYYNNLSMVGCLYNGKAEFDFQNENFKENSHFRKTWAFDSYSNNGASFDSCHFKKDSKFVFGNNTRHSCVFSQTTFSNITFLTIEDTSRVPSYPSFDLSSPSNTFNGYTYFHTSHLRDQVLKNGIFDLSKIQSDSSGHNIFNEESNYFSDGILLLNKPQDLIKLNADLRILLKLKIYFKEVITNHFQYQTGERSSIILPIFPRLHFEKREHPIDFFLHDSASDKYELEYITTYYEGSNFNYYWYFSFWANYYGVLSQKREEILRNYDQIKEYIAAQKTSNIELQKETIDWIDYQKSQFEITYAFYNKSYLKYIWLCLLEVTVHSGYNGTVNFIFSSLFLVLVFSFVFFKRYRSTITVYANDPEKYVSEFSDSEALVSNPTLIQSLLLLIKRFFMAIWRIINVRKWSIVNMKNNWNGIIRWILSIFNPQLSKQGIIDFTKCFWFSFVVYINPRLSPKYFKFDNNLLLWVIAEWVVGVGMMTLFLVFIATKYPFVIKLLGM